MHSNKDCSIEGICSTFEGRFDTRFVVSLEFYEGLVIGHFWGCDPHLSACVPVCTAEYDDIVTIFFDSRSDRPFTGCSDVNDASHQHVDGIGTTATYGYRFNIDTIVREYALLIRDYMGLIGTLLEIRYLEISIIIVL